LKICRPGWAMQGVVVMAAWCWRSSFLATAIARSMPRRLQRPPAIDRGSQFWPRPQRAGDGESDVRGEDAYLDCREYPIGRSQRGGSSGQALTCVTFTPPGGSAQPQRGRGHRRAAPTLLGDPAGHGYTFTVTQLQRPAVAIEASSSLSSLNSGGGESSAQRVLPIIVGVVEGEELPPGSPCAGC
jgi:hypothetical protein